MIFFLAALTLSSAFFYGFGIGALIPVLIAVITTVSLDFLIEYWKMKKSRIPNSAFFPYSALISGLFIGGLLTQALQWYVYAFAGIIAILSKHIIKINQKHIFNPANFGILSVSIIFGVSHTWWSSSPILLVLIFGMFIIWRLRRIDLALSFLVSYYLINSAVEIFRGAQFAEIYSSVINGGVVYFFSMFMLTEPKTTPLSRNKSFLTIVRKPSLRGIAYGALVAVFFIAFSFYIPKHDLPLALALGNVFVPLLDKFK